MHVIVSCKKEDVSIKHEGASCPHEEYPIKTEGARVFTTLYINFSDVQVQVTTQSLLGFG